MFRPPSTGDHDAYFDYALSGIVDTDANWVILRVNAAAASITGRERPSFPGRRLHQMFAKDEADKVAAYLELLREQGIAHLETKLEAKDGRELVVELSSVQVGENLFVHMFDDVTAQRQMVADVHAAREAAEAANRAKSDFLANISHEIRTPMNGIIGLSRLGLMGNAPPEQRELFAKISRSGRALLQVINELLDFAKLEAGRLEFEQISFELDELVEDLAAISANAPAEPGLEIVFDLQPELPRALLGDRLRLGQILTNLLGNALKFTASGTVTLRIAPEGERHGRLWVRFEVADTGIGFAPEAMGRLFEPFGQAEVGTTRRYGGTGLGLTIAREFALGMGGDLNAHSAPGVGSTFCLRLPFAVSDPVPWTAEPNGLRFFLGTARPATRAAAERMLVAAGLEPVEDPARADLLVVDRADNPKDRPSLEGPRALLVLTGAGDPSPAIAPPADHQLAELPRPMTPAGLQRALQKLGLAGPGPEGTPDLEVPDDFVGAHLLVAEDSEVNQLVVLGLLHKAGITTTLATDGRQVLDRMASTEPKPDLILMDVRMPGMDGLDATRALRERGARLPIIGASAGASAQEQQACLQAGMNDFLPKPLDADELWGCLTRWLPPRQRSDQRSPVMSAEERFLGDRDALFHARDTFFATHRDDPAQLADALAHADREAAAHIAHRLKGAAATVGAEELAEAAARFEQLLADPTTPETAFEALLEKLSADLFDSR